MQRTSSLYYSIPSLLIIFLALAGCGGPSLVPVKGLVKVDGKPAKGVVLTFIRDGSGPEDFPATAVTEENGVFTLVTAEKSGAEIGKYKVSAIWPDQNIKLSIAEQMQGASVFDGPDLLKGKYAAGKSKLEVEVKAGSAELAPLELTP
jgi:hypothetical protein